MKKVLIINGNPKETIDGFDEYCQNLTEILSTQGNEVRLITLRGKQIADCIGCYACWVKTPGICALKDDQTEVLQGYVWADFVLLASPLIMGFVSSLLKKVNDRMIPLVHPFLRLANDRMAHLPRYDMENKIGLLLDGSIDTFEEKIDIIRQVYQRIVFIKTINQTTQEVAHEINNL